MTQTVKEWTEKFIKTEKLDEALLSELECAFGRNISDKPIDLIRTVIKEVIVAVAECWGKEAWQAGYDTKRCDMVMRGIPLTFEEWWQSVKGE